MAITNPMKIILALVIIALIGFGFYILSWNKKEQQLGQLAQTLQQKQQKLTQTKQEVLQLPVLNKQVTKLKDELNGLVASKFTTESPEMFVANYIAEVERMVIGEQEATGDYDFRIVSITPGAMENTTVGGAHKKGNGASLNSSPALRGFPTRVFQMQMTGHYSTLVDFLYKLGELSLDRLVTINKISLSPHGGNKGESPILSVTIPITAYLREGGT